MAKKKHRRRHKESFWSEFRFEIFIAFLFLLGVFLLVEQMEIKVTLFHWITYSLRSMAKGIYGLASRIRDLMIQVETSDIVGIVLIITAVILLALRFRKKIIYRYSQLYSCPDCKGELRRTHRTMKHKILEFILFVRIKHYHCKQCSYSGIRITVR